MSPRLFARERRGRPDKSMTPLEAATQRKHWPRLRPALFILGALIIIGFSSFITAQLWRENGLRSLQAVNEQRVQLVANAIHAEISRQDHLPVVLSLDADVRSALGAIRTDLARSTQLNEKLRR